MLRERVRGLAAGWLPGSAQSVVGAGPNPTCVNCGMCARQPRGKGEGAERGAGMRDCAGGGVLGVKSGDRAIV